jgi:hypothetical protein
MPAPVSECKTAWKGAGADPGFYKDGCHSIFQGLMSLVPKEVRRRLDGSTLSVQ